MSRPGRLIRWPALASFLPPALAVVYAAVIGRDGLAVAGTLWLLGSGAMLLMMNRRLGP